MGRLIHTSDLSEVHLKTEGSWPRGEDQVQKQSGSKPWSELLITREIGVLENLNGVIGPKLISVTNNGDGMIMSRVGTHDLSDIMHDLTKNEFNDLLNQFFSELIQLHKLGFVHRDLKPSNIMMTQKTSQGGLTYAGIIDFGLTLRINRKQNEKRALGGTAPYCHRSQLKGMEDIRAHPGQDWYAAGLSMMHTILGGSHTTFEAGLAGGDTMSQLRPIMAEIWPHGPTDQLLNFFQLCASSESNNPEKLDELLEDGIAAFRSLSALDSISKDNIAGFQRNIDKRPKRHDVLIIIDSTGSMESQIEDLRNTFQEVVETYAKEIDVRVDLWCMGDYSLSEEGKDVVEPLGERMRRETFGEAAHLIKADRTQTDEAEAYEVALQFAYLTKEINNQSHWNPRLKSTRTIVLVGDSYAHGWLQKKHNPWGKIINDAFGRKTPSGERQGGDMEIQKLYTDFERRHPHYFSRIIRNNEKDATDSAVEQMESLDGRFGGRGKIKAGRGGGFANRANYEKAVKKCVSQKLAHVHTIAAGNNLVNHSFMKYIAMIGDGTYTHIKDGELKHALAGIITMVDKKSFDLLAEDVNRTDPKTQVLSAQTTFVLDSL
jgi:serine/threonine protein kinase